jgi:phosphate transport system substrate-binding protein
MTVQVGVKWLNRPKTGVGDMTNDYGSFSSNVNVLLKRPDDWKKIIDEPVIDIEEMDIIDGSTATIPITIELFRQFYGMNDYDTETRYANRHNTTHKAYLNLINRALPSTRYKSEIISLIFVTPPSDEELQAAAEKGVTLDMAAIAKDGFVFITHKDNPVDSLTVEQIRGIYSGAIANWKDVGGKDLPIKAYQRELNSGSQTAMLNLVMKGIPMIEPIDTTIYVGMGDLVDAVAEYQNGPASIGYTYNYYINNLYKNENVKTLKVEGISSDDANLINGTYPFTTAYFAVMRADERADSPARKLRDFLLSEKGQRLIEMAGYCRSVMSNE